MHPDENARQKIYDAIDRFSTAMLSTVSPEGVIHTRPMAVASREGNALWFATHDDASTVTEVRSFTHANASFQGSLLYVSVSGPAEVVDDRQKIRSLWSETWSAWFPDGPDDPSLVLVRVEGRTADMWDLRGTNGLRSALRAVSAIVSRQLKTDEAPRHVTL